LFGIGLPELSIILILVLFIFGAGKLPAIGAGLGEGIRNFKKSVSVENKPLEKEELGRIT
jgi:sec-independent protein translocase protein TatA